MTIIRRRGRGRGRGKRMEGEERKRRKDFLGSVSVSNFWVALIYFYARIISVKKRI